RARGGHETLDAVALLRVDQRADVRFRFQAGANAKRRGCMGDAIDELRRSFSRNQKPLRRDADLSAVSKLRRGGASRQLFEVDIRKDQDRSVAAELEREAGDRL